MPKKLVSAPKMLIQKQVPLIARIPLPHIPHGLKKPLPDQRQHGLKHRIEALFV